MTRRSFWALKGNHVEVVKYMIANVFEKAYLVDQAAAKGASISTLQLLYSLQYKFSDDVILYVAFYGHLNVITWALDHGFHLTRLTCYYAAVGGQLDTLKWLRDQCCPWCSLTTTYAKTDELYAYAKCNGCPVASSHYRRTSYIGFVGKNDKELPELR